MSIPHIPVDVLDHVQLPTGVNAPFGKPEQVLDTNLMPFHDVFLVGIVRVGKDPYKP
jgi:hypothetical protein